MYDPILIMGKRFSVGAGNRFVFMRSRDFREISRDLREIAQEKK